ncbi:MAG TPA: twin-arginine translocase TatA/TatE family subunit [Armatimonadetes bacterium]|nr:twin-arginine translocase TatA/TatE family subunit [Armatimonadota bacterium]
MSVGPPEIFWLLLLGLILFGAKKLPELARSAGQALKEFKKAQREMFEEELTPPRSPSREEEEEQPRQLEVEPHPSTSASEETTEETATSG